MKTIYLIPSLLLLTGCASTPIGTISGGECRLVHAPEYAVLGKTKYDRLWIVNTEESLVRGCGQDRPKARPYSFDHPRQAKKPKTELKPYIIKTEPIAATQPDKEKIPLPPVKKKSRWWER